MANGESIAVPAPLPETLRERGEAHAIVVKVERRCHVRKQRG